VAGRRLRRLPAKKKPACGGLEKIFFAARGVKKEKFNFYYE